MLLIKQNMLSDDDFERFIYDPRLGKQKNFFKPNLESQHFKLKQFFFKPIKKIEKSINLRCNNCANCFAKDCGSCISCLDKPKFGGPGVRKQSCIKRRKCLMNIGENLYDAIENKNHEESPINF